MADLTLIVGNKNYSSWSLRPWLFMKHHNIKFEEKRVALYTDTTHDELAPYHSNFKVPVLIDRNLTVWDSLAIFEYLSEQYLDYKGWPVDARARAVARSVSAEMHSSFVHLRTEMSMNCRKQFSNIKLSANAQRDIERVKELWRMCRTDYGKEGEWLFGKFSIADAMYAPVALRFAGYSIPLTGLEASYVQSVLDHSNIIEWIEAAMQEQEVLAEFEKVVT